MSEKISRRSFLNKAAFALGGAAFVGINAKDATAQKKEVQGKGGNADWEPDKDLKAEIEAGIERYNQALSTGDENEADFASRDLRAKIEKMKEFSGKHELSEQIIQAAENRKIINKDSIWFFALVGLGVASIGASYIIEKGGNEKQ